MPPETASKPSLEAFREMEVHTRRTPGPQIPTLFHHEAWKHRAVLNMIGGSAPRGNINASLRLESLETDALGVPVWLPQGRWCVVFRPIKGRVTAERIIRVPPDASAIIRSTASSAEALLQLMLSLLWDQVVDAHLQRRQTGIHGDPDGPIHPPAPRRP